MKNYPEVVLCFAFLCLSQGISAQQKTCKSEEPLIEDLSAISICAADKGSKSSKKTKNVYRKVRKSSSRSIGVSKKNSKKSNLLNTKEVLFTIVDRVPLFSECNSTNNEKNVACFKSKISKHFSNNFDSERALDETRNKRAFVQFTIDVKGNVKDIVVKSKKKSQSLENEIKRVLKKLPTLTPGVHNSLPVNVKYGFPVNLAQD